MGRTAGIICEFNPFHSGHAHIIDSAVSNGADAVVCLMSGNFVQRGEAAIADKYIRAESAVRCGADIVLELPFPYSASSAGYFAQAGIDILDRSGLVDELWFGSENGDICELEQIAENELSDKFQKTFAKACVGSAGYAAALVGTYTALFGETSVLSLPNGILAVEYIKALKQRKSKIKPFTIKRQGDYNSLEYVLPDSYVSASAARRLICEGNTSELEKILPKEAFLTLEKAKREEIFPIEGDRMKDALLLFFRMARAEQLRGCDGIAGGLENRIIEAARGAASWEKFEQLLFTKKYTDSRLRRTLLSCVVGVREADLKAPAAFTVLLAATEKGRAFLSKARKTSEIPIITKPADIEKAGGNALRQAELSDRADALFTLCLPKKQDAAYFRRKSPFMF